MLRNALLACLALALLALAMTIGDNSSGGNVDMTQLVMDTAAEHAINLDDRVLGDNVSTMAIEDSGENKAANMNLQTKNTEVDPLDIGDSFALTMDQTIVGRDGLLPGYQPGTMAPFMKERQADADVLALAMSPFIMSESTHS